MLKRIHLLFIVCLLQLCSSATHGQNFDIDWLRSANPEHPGSDFWRAISNTTQIVSASITLGSLVYGYAKNDQELKHNGHELLLTTGINFVVTNVLKVIINRPRPVQTYPSEIYVLTRSDGMSFPSGHTSLAFATATSLTLIHHKWYIVVPAYLWASCVAYSRMYLGRHYPSDILGGAVVGTGSAVLGHYLRNKLFKKKPVAPVAAIQL